MHDFLRQACSFLFVPATRPERLAKALASGADVVIADLEDAVAPADKAGAREALLQAVQALPQAGRARLLVRINAPGTPWHGGDLQALVRLVDEGVSGAVVPKAESVQALQSLAQAAGAGAAIVPLVESVAGMHALDELAQGPQVVRLAFGHLDFQVDAGMDCDAREQELLPLRLALVLASRRAGLAAPVDGVTVDTSDTGRLRHDAQRALRLGFGGKLCIHPAQVGPLHAVFDPDEAAVAQARRVRQALEEAGGGVCQLDGRMLDAPVLKRAEQVLQRHERALRRVQGA